ncbi:hypothetical protein TD95_004951 [Thielaviopsis punctulata]|uniref:Up-regulated during septation protein 1 domain-containing protein n=1 Tax=Thielaviopsis punctulata TaxID=72032 RepID=A0A0F4ZER1_9PEZI|nr:hypothetical protein TD95_004951 [Thielaviopsis punctulata]
MASKILPAEQTRKYQLFPRGHGAMSPVQKALDPEQAFTLAMKKADPGLISSGSLRLRKDGKCSRRRKVSVPELGPMTTVQEASMDSPTLPGLRPVHERSASGPSSAGPCNWRLHIADTIEQQQQQQPLHKSDDDHQQPQQPEQPVLLPTKLAQKPAPQPYYQLHHERMISVERSASPTKNLAPIVIPRVTRSASCSVSSHTAHSRMPNSSSPVESTTSSNYTLRTSNDSPSARSPFNTAPLSGCSMASSSAASSVSHSDSRSLPHWDVDVPPAVPAKEDPVDSCHRRGSSDTPSVASARITDRGRPRTRTNSRAASLAAAAPLPDSPKRSFSSERRAFETLPQGLNLPAAAAQLPGPELLGLRAQALEQAARFEVLRAADVESMSRELRALDERVEYLKATYTSLRAGRRNLHGRILTLLRSPSRFSPDALLKQEETLSELDASIDEWTAKLDAAENRRTRVRQKLLEHMAAAAMLPVMQPSLPKVRATPAHAPAHLTTPPRSPTRPAQPPLTTHMADTQRSVSTPMLRSAAPMPAAATRDRLESICIYAGSDVYTVAGAAASTSPTTSAFAITSAFASCGSNSAVPAPLHMADREKPATAARKLREQDRKTVQRSRSFDALPQLPEMSFEAPRRSPTPPKGAGSPGLKKSPLAAPMSPRDDGVNSDTEVVYLTSAVFSG